ncbi:DUF7848 domain-containing protein [Streptomyces xiamenensis]
MSVRRLLRYRNWTLEPDVEPDSEPTKFAMRCAVCRKKSPVSVEFEALSRWVFQHVGRNPSHHSYQEIIVRPWRAWLGPPVR